VNAAKRERKLLMRIDKARIAHQSLHNTFNAMVDQPTMQSGPKGQPEYRARNFCRTG